MNVDKPLDRFTLWQYRLVRRFIPYTPRRFPMAEIELRLKELQIMLFCIGIGTVATIADAVLYH